MVFTVKGLQISVRPETRANNFLTVFPDILSQYSKKMSEEDNRSRSTVPKDIHPGLYLSLN